MLSFGSSNFSGPCYLNCSFCLKRTGGEMTALNTLLQREQGLLATRHDELLDQISEAQKELQAVKVRLSHVTGLLGSDVTPETESDEDSLPRRYDILEIAESVLSSRNGAHMHYREIAEEVQARGGHIPGVDAAKTLLARLVKDDRFIRPHQRGFYALKDDHPNVKEVGARTLLGNSDNGESETP